MASPSLARPAGSTHPVTLTCNNAAIGNLTLNGTAVFQSQLGAIEGARGLVQLGRQRYDETIVHLRAAVARKQKGIALDPSNAPLRGTLVNEASNLAATCLENGDTRCALDASQLAATVLEGLRRDEPESTYWQASGHTLSLQRGRTLLASGDAAAALAALRLSETWLLGELEENRPDWGELGRIAQARPTALEPLAGRHLARATRLGAVSTPR